MTDISMYDSWLVDRGPAAIVTRELLEPVEGSDGVFFPATYAAAEDRNGFPGGYNIDVFPSPEESIGSAVAAMISSGKSRFRIENFPRSPNICLVDSVGSQANRIEPVFESERYRHLVPQIWIIAGDKRISLLRAGHRAGDALIRFSTAAREIWDAFTAIGTSGNALPLAKLAPTSLLFGAWDSRGTQVKIARAFRSVIRAHNVRTLTRPAQYNRATKYVEQGLISESLDVGSEEKNPLSREGFNDNPVKPSHGGVIADGELRREMTINLSAIRRLRAQRVSTGSVSEMDLSLRRYVLGLALVAATALTDEMFDLREGCQLCLKPGSNTEWREVSFRGESKSVTGLNENSALEFATIAATAFGVGPSNEFEFNKEVAEKWLKLKKEDQDKLRRVGPITSDLSSGSPAESSKHEEAKSLSSGRNRKSR